MDEITRVTRVRPHTSADRTQLSDRAFPPESPERTDGVHVARVAAAFERGAAAVAAAVAAAAISIIFCGVLHTHTKCRRALNESLTLRYVSALDDDANLNRAHPVPLD